MLKFFILLFFILVTSFAAKAQSPWYFGTGEAVNLTNGTAYKNGVKTIAGSLNPSSTAVSAPAGSMYYSTSGTIYVKQDAGLTTNWLPLGIATTGSLTTINGQSGPNVSIATGSSGSDFNISASSNTITLNLPSASGSSRGLLTSADWSDFNSKEPAISSGTTSQFWRGDKTFVSLAKSDVGLNNVDNTSDANKPVSTAQQTALDLKEDVITPGTSSQYWRGDKTWQTLDKTAVGLNNVDNTSDLNKPVSTATQSALDGKIAGVASSVDSEVILFSGTTGKASKRATGTGYAKLTSGVLSTSSTVAASDLTGQVALANGGTNKSLSAVNGGVVYTDADSQEVTSAGTSGQVLQSNGAASPTFVNKSISGKAQNKTAITLEEIQVPNNQLTLVTGSKYLAETGNKNILDDASFEGSNVSGSWSLTGGSYVSDNTPIDGAFNALIQATGSSFALSQDATLYQAQFADGVQGLAMVRVRTSVTSTPIYVCYRQAGNSGAIGSGCVQVQANGKWNQPYKIPFILGGTSNGIIVTSNGVAITGDVEVDDAFVGPVDLKQDVDQSRIAGESYFAGTSSCNWARTSATIGAFSSVSACPGPTIVSSTMGSWQTTDADLPRQTINNLPAGTYKAKFFVKAAMTANAVMGFAINDGTTTCEPHGGVDILTGYVGQVVECTFTYTSSGNRTFELYAGSASSTVNILNSTTSPRISAKFILEYFGSGSVYSASCGANCVDTLTATVSTAGAISKTNVAGWITSGAGSSGNYTVSFTSGVFNTAPRCECNNDDGNTRYCSVTSVTTSGAQVTTTTTSTATNANFSISCSKVGTDFTATRTIQGTFNEVMTSTGTTKPDFQGLVFGSGANCASACTTGTCTICNQIGNRITSITWANTGTYDINGLDGTKYSCNGSGLGTSNYTNIRQDIANSTSTKVRIVTGAAGAENSHSVSTHCLGSLP